MEVTFRNSQPLKVGSFAGFFSPIPKKGSTNWSHQPDLDGRYAPFTDSWYISGCVLVDKSWLVAGFRWFFPRIFCSGVEKELGILEIDLEWMVYFHYTEHHNQQGVVPINSIESYIINIYIYIIFTNKINLVLIWLYHQNYIDLLNMHSAPFWIPSKPHN